MHPKDKPSASPARKSASIRSRLLGALQADREEPKQPFTDAASAAKVEDDVFDDSYLSASSSEVGLLDGVPVADTDQRSNSANDSAEEPLQSEASQETDNSIKDSQDNSGGEGIQTILKKAPLSEQIKQQGLDNSDGAAQAPMEGPNVAKLSNANAVEQAVEQAVSSKSTKPTLKPLDIRVPAEIGRYAIGVKIGSGTCGVVHRAFDNVLNREVAIKLSPIGEAHVSTGKVPGAQRAYQTEIHAAGKLRHQNIVTVYDAGQYEELNYLVMEYVEGRTLKEFGKGQSPLPVHRALEVIVDCCKALDYSHAQGIIHRDIKPANIILSNEGEVKLLDFGIAVGIRPHGDSKQGPTLGTPNYMSPEQILSRDLGPASDFYSLATVLFELLTSRQLFKAQKVKDLFRTVVQQVAPRLTDVKPDFPIGLADVMAKALEKRPSRRFQSGAELSAALRPYIDEFKVIELRPPEQQAFIDQLYKQAFFEKFNKVEVANFVEIARHRRFSANEVLIQENTHNKSLFVIVSGAVVVSKYGRFIQVINEGECVGENGFIQGDLETHCIRAATDVQALEVTAAMLDELAARIHLHYYKVISDILDQRREETDQAHLDIVLE